MRQLSLIALLLIGCAGTEPADTLTSIVPPPPCEPVVNESNVDTSRSLVTCFPTVYLPSFVYLPVLASKLANVRAGDSYLVISEFEVTNDTGTDVMIAGQLSASPSLVDGASGQQRFGARNGFNVTMGMHHGVFMKTAVWTADRDYDSLFIVLHAWAATDGVGPSSLAVEQYTNSSYLYIQKLN